jgi:hypothetical protein
MNGDNGRSIAMPPPAFCDRPDRQAFDALFGLTGPLFLLVTLHWRPI